MKSLDLSNKTFGDWTVTKLGTYQGTHKRWWCKCRCGTELQVLQTSLVRGASHSCGCWKTKIGRENCNWNGHEEISGSQWASIRSGAKNRKILFNVSLKEGWELFLKQNRKCALSGVELIFSTSYNRELATKTRSETTASLDRIDSSKGYTIDNVQWVHKNVNMMKRKMSDSDFIMWCNRITFHQSK